MKKLFVLFAAAMLSASVSAQTVQESKTFDNIYIGVNGGVATKTTGNRWLSNLNPNAGLRIGRWFTPVFGLAIEGNAYFSNKPAESVGTVVRGINTQLLGTVNLSNWFGGYKGEPRAFEVVALYGLGWGHLFGTQNGKQNNMTSKAGLDFAFNLGANKAWQIYVEPAIVWGLAGNSIIGKNEPRYDINTSYVQLNAGIIYKFNNSNGTHNFKIVEPRDQAEIDALNAQINELGNGKPEVVEKIVEKVVQAPAAVEQVYVTFAQGKSDLTSAAKADLDAIVSGKHVRIIGTASPEGNKPLNDKLSQARADVVADYLKARGVIVDEAVGKGVQGITSNRLAIVTVK